tara:strand:- start:156 stop:683 length:528 start_codon:yes stop_codon:yes gene_type:complete
MIKLYLIVLIIIFLYILIYNNKEPFAKCNSGIIPSEPLLINGGLINDKIHIYWNIPFGLENIKDITYDIIYNTNDSNVTQPVTTPIGYNHTLEIKPKIDETKDKNLYSYRLNNRPLKDGEYYNITLNMTINEKQTLSSNTLIINKTSDDNPMIRYLSNPNDIFANLKNKSIDIII